MSCVVLAAGAARASYPVCRARAVGMLLALLLGAGVACASTAAVPEQAYTSNCSLLTAKSAEVNIGMKDGGWRSVSEDGRPMNVTLVWGSEPARAAAALLAVLLRRVRQYRGVRLARASSPLGTAALAAAAPFSMAHRYDELIIALSTAWEPKAAPPWVPRKGMFPGLAGPRLEEFGVSPVSARRRLFAWLAPHVGSACSGHERWAFYNNRTALEDCHFVNAQAQDPTVDVLAVGDCNDTLKQLEERANATHTRLKLQFFDRAQFLYYLNTANHSFLFLDWDMWQGEAGVSVVEPPPCVTFNYDCKQELDSSVAMRVADVDMLMAHASQLFYFVYDFNPSPESLRQIIKRQASGIDIEEAACEWALKNKSYELIPQYDFENYAVITYFCQEDSDSSFFINISEIVKKEVYNQTMSVVRWIVPMHIDPINCSDKNSLNFKIHDWKSKAGYLRILGIVSLSVEGVAAASQAAMASHMPLMLADVAPDRDGAEDATWRVAGRPRHLTLALLRLIREAHWTRLAVLSQNTTELAADYYATLKEQADVILGEFSIPLNLEGQRTHEVLQDLRDTNARIVFVNANFQTAATILSAAAAAGMGYSDGFVWIVRDWREGTMVCETKHISLSFWSRGVKDLPPAEEWAPLREQLGALRPAEPWPPRAVSLVDALLSLTMGFKEVFRRYPDTRQDLRTEKVIKSLQEVLSENPVAGVSQRLHYAERSIEETQVFVDQWCGGNYSQRLASWSVNATSGAVHGDFSRPNDLPQNDGASSCIVQTGDQFVPKCHDAECAFALLLLALFPVAVLLTRRAILRRLARLKQEQLIQVIARRRHVATVLAEYLVERAALELREELGSGRFGSVCLARLRVPGRAPRYIAAKALRENAAPAEESEFLREACTIASLEHAHIVRLVGVCIADGPPLVLMELAFFGDLLGYLRERRHLVEGTGSEEPAESGEAEHVSAEALTRLACEAAQALQYLSTRGVVHRDVRAANCLVDVRRSLKLADFGMARDTVTGADGAPEYSCRRRGLFPVLWMAPESLAHGVFSAASDVWALGVLMLELVTLGVRPYGSMSPLRVLEYVAAGGSPPLPLDATPQTRGLARLCWARAAERRPSAAQVAAYLAAWPRALSPALLGQRDEPADADSGFGESPSTELLPPDSPLHSLVQHDDLAATR